MISIFEDIAKNIYGKGGQQPLKDGDDILSLFPYYEYEPTYGLHRLRSGNLAAAWIFDDIPLDNELNMNGRVNVLATVQSMINDCSAGTHIQVIKRITRNIRNYCDKMKASYTQGEPIARRVLEEDLNKLLKGAEDKALFEYEQKEFWIKTYDNMLTLVFKPNITKKDGKEKLIKGERNIYDHIYEREAKLCLKTCKTIESSFTKLGVLAKRVTGDDLQTYLEEWFNPVTTIKQGTSKFRSDIPMYKNILKHSPSKPSPKGYCFEGKHSLVMTVEEPPSYSTKLGLFGGEVLNGDKYESLIDIINEGIIVFNIFLEDTQTTDKRVRELNADHIRSTKVTRLTIDAEGDKIKDDCFHALKNISVHKQLGSKTRIHVIVRGTEDENEEMANAVSSYIRGFQMQLITEYRHGRMLEEQCWPFNFRYWSDNNLMRCIDLIVDNLSCMLPIYGSKTERKIAPIFFVNDRGYIYPWNPIRKGEANHIYIDGKTGSGKSFCGNRILLGLLLLPDVIIYGIDVGASQQQVIQSCRNYKYDILDPARPPKYNPVYGPLNEVTRAQMTQRIALMIEGGPSAVKKIDSKERQLIGQAITKAFMALRVMEHEGVGARDKVIFREFSELQKFFDRGDILGSEEYFAWFSCDMQMNFDNAKQAEKSDNITTSYSIFKAAKFKNFAPEWKSTVLDCECNIREFKGDVYLLYDQEMRKNLAIDKISKLQQTDEKLLCNENITFLVFAIFEVEEDVGQIERFGLKFIEKEVYGEAYIQREVRLSDIMNALNEPDTDNEDMKTISKRLAFELLNFCKGGEFGQYFDGYNTLTWDSNFMGWEFKALLARDKFVASLMLSSLLSQISIRVKDKRLKKYLKVVYFDETWQFVKAGGPIVMEIIEDAVRTWRKEGGILIVSTQGISEIKEQPGGEDIYNQFAYYIHMRQDNPDEIIQAGNLMGKQAEKFKKLLKASGKFSEGILMTGSTDWSKFKCITSAYTFCALAMDTELVIGRSKSVEKLINEGMNMENAIIEAPALLAKGI